jgi:hypothetical protein
MVARPRCVGCDVVAKPDPNRNQECDSQQIRLHVCGSSSRKSHHGAMRHPERDKKLVVPTSGGLLFL